MESTDTTSPLKRWASATPIFVLPQAVGPTTQMTFSVTATSFGSFTPV